ncbi:MAG TPA: hypothetical protein VJA23_03055 [Candidatus Nanoarchaeia archaeon]|nr:hypothetical protein [Candidatus Nanoarchaeia archaeon]
MNLIRELENVEKDYAKARMDLVKRWANYVKTHSDKVWSKQHNKLINSYLKNVKQLPPEQYLAMKGEICTRKSN